RGILRGQVQRLLGREYHSVHHDAVEHQEKRQEDQREFHSIGATLSAPNARYVAYGTWRRRCGSARQRDTARYIAACRPASRLPAASTQPRCFRPNTSPKAAMSFTSPAPMMRRVHSGKNARAARNPPMAQPQPGHNGGYAQPDATLAAMDHST